ncbi:rhomboid family intramembrane serine protease [Pedobacter sp. Du54]|uniref:rhomboid family intramembrane serine protease n=1 Tax=Pedobacter anseongensis TaxID=3133439 RepID=UPI0030B210A9
MNRGLLHDLHLKFFKSGSPAMLYIGINVLIFILASLLGVFAVFAGNRGWADFQIQTYFAFPADLDSLPTRFYTLLTYQFFHDGLFHILFNMLWLYWIGQIFLDFLKPRQFHFVYIGGGIFGALFFMLLFNFVPAFSAQKATLIGSSASVMAILGATTTLVPDYSFRLLLIGEVKLKYLALAYVFLDILGTAGDNAGGSIAHLGGALFGFIFIKLLQNGKDWSTIFKRKPKLKVVRNKAPEKSEIFVNQKDIDAILDKISKSGYDQLSKEEKETLFKASKN